MSVKIHGRDYKTVAERLGELHDKFKSCSIRTEILNELSGGEFVTMKATIVLDTKDMERVFTGHAREVFTKTGINSTSAYENAETSAIGRALASAGFTGAEFASADEVATALKQQTPQVDSPKDIAKAAGLVELFRTAKTVDELNAVITENKAMLDSLSSALKAWCRDEYTNIKSYIETDDKTKE